ncbi:DUF6325 family protein [Streptacidiphilus sp. N1-10]|uniref:DUF6325 family protein n=1 Tax=Streptacidiphilus jeojiensis TaxID=3229225 RepID=A0ABV6XJ95_9ACTN
MPVGPVEFLVLAFPGETIGADVIAPLTALRDSGGVRVIDTMVVTKAADGSVASAELVDLEHLRGLVDPAGNEVNLMGEEDAAEAAELLQPGSSALLVLVEHLWATAAAEAFRRAGGHVAASVRIPPEFVSEAHRALATAQ